MTCYVDKCSIHDALRTTIQSMLTETLEACNFPLSNSSHALSRPLYRQCPTTPRAFKHVTDRLPRWRPESIARGSRLLILPSAMQASQLSVTLGRILKANELRTSRTRSSQCTNNRSCWVSSGEFHSIVALKIQVSIQSRDEGFRFEIFQPMYAGRLTRCIAKDRREGAAQEPMQDFVGGTSNKRSVSVRS